jgi:hypothetical protein
MVDIGYRYERNTEEGRNKIKNEKDNIKIWECEDRNNFPLSSKNLSTSIQ